MQIYAVGGGENWLVALIFAHAKGENVHKLKLGIYKISLLPRVNMHNKQLAHSPRWQGRDSAQFLNSCRFSPFSSVEIYMKLTAAVPALIVVVALMWPNWVEFYNQV